MSTFIKKPSLSEKRRQPWDFREFVEYYSGKSLEQVVREQKEKREKK